MSEESVTKGESQTESKEHEGSTEKLKEPVPSEDCIEEKSVCSKQGPLLTHNLLNGTESLLNGRDPTEHYSHSRWSTGK